MNRQRALGWLAFFSVAGIIALIPEFFPREAAPDPLLPGRPEAAGAALDDSRPGSASSAASEAGSRTPAVPQTDLFAPRSWRVSPPLPAISQIRVAAAPPTPPPAAPPLPFEFIGKLDDASQLKVFLLRDEQLHTVVVGDVIDGTYRVQGISGNEMTLVYLPLNVSQSLSVGSNP